MRILVTGADGFIGKNLVSHLKERNDVEIVNFTKRNSLSELPSLLKGVDFVCHLAGVNRPQVGEDFKSGNKYSKHIFFES